MTSDSSTPELVARLKLGPDGKPAVVETGGKRHYGIVIEVKNAPRNAYAATFELDPTYYDPVRTMSPASDGGFRLETTTFGDYDLNVVLRTDDGRQRSFGSSLSTALRKGLPEIPDGELQAALSEIASH